MTEPLTDRELDAWIAEHVMGWIEKRDFTRGQDGCIWPIGKNRYFGHILFQPAEDLNACAQAEAKIMEFGLAYIHGVKAALMFSHMACLECGFPEIHVMMHLNARQRCEAMHAIREDIEKARGGQVMPDDKHARVAREIIELTFVPNDLATLDKIDAVLRREYDLMPECGHPAQCVSTSDEGTSYCSWCAELSGIKARLEAARVEALREAAKAICLWCSGHPVWQQELPTRATRSASGSWWHNESPDGAFAGCLAGPIHELIEATEPHGSS